MVLFYALTRTINIPTIGLQPDIGIIDISAKVVQVGIVAISSYLIISVVRRRKQLESSLVENQQNRKYRMDRSKYTKTDFSDKSEIKCLYCINIAYNYYFYFSFNASNTTRIIF